MPCPPFSIAGKQLGRDDERDLFPQALRLVEEIGPRAVLLENVRGLAARRFDGYRTQVLQRLHGLGYQTWWDVVQASQHGVPQLRPRFVLVALRQPWASWFRWPEAGPGPPPTVGGMLADLMAARGWPGAADWAAGARGIAPTIVGGSKKHGGPDLGPTRAREAWKGLGVDGLGIGDDAPGPSFPVDQRPKLTVRMVARLQGFPDSWEFSGRKTAAYRQVGNAFPPPVARALGAAIRDALAHAGPARDAAPAGPGRDAAPAGPGPGRRSRRAGAGRPRSPRQLRPGLTPDHMPGPGWPGSALTPVTTRALAQASLRVCCPAGVLTPAGVLPRWPAERRPRVPSVTFSHISTPDPRGVARDGPSGRGRRRFPRTVRCFRGVLPDVGARCGGKGGRWQGRCDRGDSASGAAR